MHANSKYGDSLLQGKIGPCRVVDVASGATGRVVLSDGGGSGLDREMVVRAIVNSSSDVSESSCEWPAAASDFVSTISTELELMLLFARFRARTSLPSRHPELVGMQLMLGRAVAVVEWRDGDVLGPAEGDCCEACCECLVRWDEPKLRSASRPWLGCGRSESKSESECEWCECSWMRVHLQGVSRARSARALAAQHSPSCSRRGSHRAPS